VTVVDPTPAAAQDGATILFGDLQRIEQKIDSLTSLHTSLITEVGHLTNAIAGLPAQITVALRAIVPAAPAQGGLIPGLDLSALGGLAGIDPHLRGIIAGISLIGPVLGPLLAGLGQLGQGQAKG
jgi:hypothetical protein